MPELTLDPQNGRHRDQVRVALKQAITRVVDAERKDIPNAEGLASLIVLGLEREGWV